jgi:hypothetical protein
VKHERVGNVKGKSGLTRRDVIRIGPLALGSVFLAACANRLGIPPTSTVIPTESATSTRFPTDPAEDTPSPEPTSVPTSIPGEFEYDFDSNRPGDIPGELEGAGGTQEVVFSIAESSNGSINTDILKERGFVPIVAEQAGDGVLGAEMGRISFLPYPAEMLFENMRGELEEVSFSEENSLPGVESYVDSRGIVRSRMVTTLPTPEEGHYTSAVGFNPENPGVVYGFRLGQNGQILEQLPLVFDANTEIITTLVNGGARIYIDGERILPVNGEFEAQPRTGLVGAGFIELANIPNEQRAPLDTERVATLRFKDSTGNPLPYGYFNEYDGNTSTPDFVIRFHARLRGRVPLESLQRQPGIQAQAFLLEIPVEEVSPENRRFEETGLSQFMLLFIPTDPRNTPPNIYWLEDRTVTTETYPSYPPLPYAEVARVLGGLPQGASIIIGEQFYSTELQGLIDQENAIIAGIKDGLPVDTMAALYENIDFYLDRAYRP